MRRSTRPATRPCDEGRALRRRITGAFFVALALGQSLDVGAPHRRRFRARGRDGDGRLPAGLAVEQDGYRLVQAREAFVAGRSQQYVFRILGPDGKVVRDYDVEHERLLHLIVVARSPERVFLHLHPRQRPDGAWTVPLKLPVNGSYRVFADFTTAGERRTLGRRHRRARRPEALGRPDLAVRRRPHPRRRATRVRRDAGNPVKLQPLSRGRGASRGPPRGRSRLHPRACRRGRPGVRGPVPEHRALPARASSSASAASSRPSPWACRR